MKQLNTAEQFRNLKIRDIVYHVYGGQCHEYKFQGMNCMAPQTTIVLISDSNVLTAKSINIKDVDKMSYKAKWFIGEYDSKFLGDVMISQLKKDIKDIEEVYLRDIKNL